MEIYQTLKEVVNSIDFRIIHWEFQDSDNVFDRNALLYLADELEPTFNPEGLNYYMALPDGEILLLLMQEKQILSLFVPYQMPEKAPEPKPAEAPQLEFKPATAPAPETKPAEPPKQQPEAKHEIRFCSECGTPLRPGANFCANCGKSVKK